MAPIKVLDVDIRSKYFADKHALGKIAFCVAAGEFIVMTGPSGIGKTTVLNLVAGLKAADEGRIQLAPGLRQNLVYAFQTPRLLEWRTVLENLTLVLPDNDHEKARAMLRQVGMAENENLFPRQLSTGMQRRVALARAFIMSPRLMLMDEPFTSLDEANAKSLRQLLKTLVREHSTTTLFVTHDQREAIELADRIIVLGGTPTTIVKEIAVDLTAQERQNGEQIEAFRNRCFHEM